MGFAFDGSVGLVRGSCRLSCGSVGYDRRHVASIAVIVDSCLTRSEALSRQLLSVLSCGPSLATFCQVLQVGLFRHLWCILSLDGCSSSDPPHSE